MIETWYKNAISELKSLKKKSGLGAEVAECMYLVSGLEKKLDAKLKINGGLMKMKVPAYKDIIQEIEGEKIIPEIRVWVHPGKGRDDFYRTFLTFKDALNFIKKYKGQGRVENYPLIAYLGYELNIFQLVHR